MNNTTTNTFNTGLRRSYKLVIAIIVVGFALATLAALKVHTKYTASASVLAIDGASESNQGSTDTSNGAKNPILLGDLPMLATSGAVLTNVQKDLHALLTVDQLRQGVRATVASGSAIVHVQFTSRNPALAIVATNAIAHEVAMYFRMFSTERYDSVIKDLTSQLSVLSRRLEDLDTSLGTQAKQYPFVDVSSQSGGGGVSVYDRLTQLRSQKDDAAAAVAADQSNLTGSQSLIENSRPVAERDLAENDPVYKSLAEQYAKDNEQLQHVKSFGNFSYPGLAELESTVANEAQAVADARARLIKRNLSGNTAYAAANDAITHEHAQLLADDARLSAITSDLTTLEGEIGSGSIASSVARIRRDRDDTDTAYRVLASKLAEVQAERAQAAAIGSLMVLDHAVSAAPQMLTSGTYMALGIAFLTLWIAGSVIMFASRPEPRRLDTFYSFDGHVNNVKHDDTAPTIATTAKR